MEKQRMQKLALGLGALTLVSFGFGKFFDSRCPTSSCIGAAFADNAEGLKKLEKFQIFLDEDDQKIVINGRDGRGVQIIASDSGESLGGDEHNPSRKSEPVTESFAGKALKDIEIKSYVTDWKIVDSADDQIRFVFRGYLPPKEWTVTESSDRLVLEVKKKGPLQGEMQIPKSFAGKIQLSNISGDVSVDKLAQSEAFEVATVSGDLILAAAPARHLTINTVSGDVKFDPPAVKKDLEFDYNSVSGDLNATLKSGIKTFEAKSVSGNVNLKAGKTVGFTFEMEGVSASYEGLPKGTTTHKEGFGNRSASGSFGQDPKGRLQFNSVSGDFNLEQAN